MDRPLAVVTGASSGIGLELSSAVTVQPLQADLRLPREVERVHAAIGRVPMAVAFNAGIGGAGRFVDEDVTGLHDEFRDTGITVTSSMPGATDTEFFRRASMLDTPLGRLPFKGDPAKTAKQGYDALMRGDRRIVASSLFSKLVGATATVLPDSAKALANRLIVTPLGDR